MPAEPTTYSRTQVALHWLIALAVGFQLLMGENIAPAYHAINRGQTPTADQMFVANVHVWVGLGILAFALWRVVLRLKRGAPKPPADEPAFLQLIARMTHIALYTLILLVPLSGISAWYLGISVAGELHELAKLPFIALILLHVAGALYQHFILKSDVLKRMLRLA